MTMIQPIERNRQVIGWNVTLDAPASSDAMFSTAIMVDVMIDDLPIPNYPTDHQIIHVARIKTQPAVPPKRLKRRRCVKTAWSKAHDVCQVAAQENGLDIELVVSLLPDALATLTAEWEATEVPKRRARELTGLTLRDVERIERHGADYSDLAHFDEFANELAYECPELNWSVDDANSDNLWALLHMPAVRKPARYGQETIDRACEFAADRFRGEIEFAEWSEDDTFEPTAEYVPF